MAWKFDRIKLGPIQLGNDESRDATRLDPGFRKLAPHSSNDPFALLSWHVELSALEGRESELTALWDWLKSDANIDMKFISGPGGAGKSRLAAHFAHLVQMQEGWAAGIVRSSDRKEFLGGKKGTLLVMDYPESNRELVGELFKDLEAVPHDYTVRILFLTRGDLAHWIDLAVDAGVREFLDTEPVALQPPALNDICKIFSNVQNKIE